MYVDTEMKIRNHFEKNLSLLKNDLSLLGGNKQNPSFSELKIGLGLICNLAN